MCDNNSEQITFGDRHGHDCMVVGFTTTCVQSVSIMTGCYFSGTIFFYIFLVCMLRIQEVDELFF
jgi:hypothetical protein